MHTSASTIAGRIKLADQYGFQAVEIPYPVGELLDVAQAIKESGILISLINISIDNTNDDLKYGSTSIPGEEQLFQKQLNETIEFAKTVNCKKIHLMAGVVNKKLECEHYATYVSNLKEAADILLANNMIGVIEPINKYAIPSYYMDSFAKASTVLKELKSNNIKLMVDLYHLQHICGNFTKTLEEYRDVIAHFQIAQVPNRDEPDSPGELNYDYIFKTIQLFGYDDWIGCEYKPKKTTVAGLKWISKYINEQ
ncbi:putative hydroxypyruvate isomerase isoform X2 [Drosophila mojavensis]|uniref:putative hydroxypyruvate isomerase isoform X2 n=1 Tax=Drosophila mojavensis TaxID=7230 RepID=UPI0013EE7BA4|nr:putative hydroxypyruvate isomerase isoform X2 [Drosophila mojavensis]